MKHMLRFWIGLSAVALAIVVMGGSDVAGQKQDEFRFRSGVDLVNVTATVTDRNGRFVPACARTTSSSTRKISCRKSRASATTGCR